MILKNKKLEIKFNQLRKKFSFKNTFAYLHNIFNYKYFDEIQFKEKNIGSRLWK